MSKDLSAEHALRTFSSHCGRGRLQRSLVDAGGALFKDGEPAEPDLQRRYRLYKRAEAAFALPSALDYLCDSHPWKL